METKMETKPKDMSAGFNKVAYGAFILLGIYFLLISHDLSAAVSNFGIALVFDPFDQQVKWGNRPLWQRVWLIVHVVLLFAGFIYMLVR